MIQTQQLAERIEQELNGVIHATALGIKFKIHATEGLYYKAQRRANGTKQAYINGILRASGGDYTPISNINNLQTNMILDFVVPKDQVHDFELITTSWIEDVLGDIYTIGSWSYLITPTPATPGQLDDRTPIGEVIPYSIVLGIQIIKNGMIGNAVNWTITSGTEIVDDLPVPITGRIGLVNASFSSTRTPDTKPKANDGYCTTDNQFEASTIVMTFPYSYTKIVKKIVNDILTENWDEEYVITRNDSYADSITRTCVMTQGQILEESGKIVAITCTFARKE